MMSSQFFILVSREPTKKCVSVKSYTAAIKSVAFSMLLARLFYCSFVFRAINSTEIIQTSDVGCTNSFTTFASLFQTIGG